MSRPLAGLFLTAALAAGVASADSGSVVVAVTYVRPDGSQIGAFALNSDGVASVEHRGTLLQVKLPPRAVGRLRERLSGESLNGASQTVFDAAIDAGAKSYGLITPIPAADECRLQLPDRSLRCVGSAVLANRMPSVAAAQDFERLRAELEQLAGVVILGGVEQLHDFLRAAGEATGSTVRLSDLSYADRFGGETVAHFATPGGIVVVTSRDGFTEARVLETGVQ